MILASTFFEILAL